MNDVRTLHSGAFNNTFEPTKEEWEEWEDDEPGTPIEDGDGPLISPGAGSPSKSANRTANGRRPSISSARQSMQKIKRLKSRQRQKAQNAKVGIRLETDMSKFRQQQHIAQQMRAAQENRESRTGKFVDAAALKALEGGVSPEASNSFGWLKRKQTKGKKVDRLAALQQSPTKPDLSPGPGPIVIGFEMPGDSDVVISPQTAVVETPIEFPIFFDSAPKNAPPIPTASVWSPDTEDGWTPKGAGFPRAGERGNVPAVPSIPAQHRDNRRTTIIVSDDEDDYPTPQNRKANRDTRTTTIHVSDDEDDVATPVTLFEEDGSPRSPRRKSTRAKARARSGTGASTRSQGWWDQVTTPFVPSPVTPQTTSPTYAEPANNANEWWKGADKKVAPSSGRSTDLASSSRGVAETRLPPKIVIEDTSRTVEASPSSSNPAPRPARAETRAMKAQILAEEYQAPGEEPPPYSPPSRNHAIRYRAVFPPGHPLNNMYPPSPGPVSPGLAGTMTSQGAIGLTNVPLTPPPVATHSSRHVPLPDRPAGSYLPGDHFFAATGNGRSRKIEQRRRRHEKEDAMARKVGGFWRGRGCIPENGCYGRSGREGRKRRRIWLGVCAGMLGLIILAVVLVVVLTRKTVQAVSTPYSQWLNLTNFPPIPTGISTVIGPDSDATTVCVQPATLWSCSLPKEQAASVAPYDADQPSFIFQIQFDNNTRGLWNVPAGIPPTPTPTDGAQAGALQTAVGNQTRPTATATAKANIPTKLPSRSGPVGVVSLLRRLAGMPQRRDASGYDTGITPDPSPPNFQDMWFLGNTTDGVVSDAKAGEPTPFYISMLKSINSTIGPNVLSRRAASDTKALPSGDQKNLTNSGLNVSAIVPPPALNPDGTGAPAVLFPHPIQQPLRLYDRGLPTERYGFYTYYNKTIYVKSVTPLDNTTASQGPVPADLNGGALESEANFVVTWLSARFKVEIWTRRANSTQINSGGPSNNSTRPGTMPYPVTVTLDTHGGVVGYKYAFVRGVDARQHINLYDAKFVLNFMDNNGVVINPGGTYNPSFGGMDGGLSGCKCAYTNFVGSIPTSSFRSLLTLAIETSCDDTCVAVLDTAEPPSTSTASSTTTPNPPPSSAARLLFNKKITSDNTAFEGIHPAVAVVGHSASLAGLVQEALHSLPPARSTHTQNNTISTLSIGGVLRKRPDLVAVTRGPGMNANLAAGLNTAKGLAVAWGVPLLGVHHMQAHALTPRLVHALNHPPTTTTTTTTTTSQHTDKPIVVQNKPEFPFLTLLVSGGHTQLVLSRSLTSHRILASNSNIAIGVLLDRVARLVLPDHIKSRSANVMYGAQLESFAFPEHATTPGDDDYHYIPPAKRMDEIKPYQSRTGGWSLTAPYHDRRAMDYEFSGLGSHVQRVFDTLPEDDMAGRRELASAAMKLAFEHLASRVIFALSDLLRDRHNSPPKQTQTDEQQNGDDGVGAIRTLVVSGGVASNKYLRHILRSVLDVRGFGGVDIVAPPVELCTDNAAMIAWTATEMYRAGYRSRLDILPIRKWTIDPEGPDGGILGVDGWITTTTPTP
ncbi:glycoprotease family-domain-containing protein [Diplogelasinospora grovesii]|uniref:Glycoprotease family-domain-containing protein n=1 Tax=Diplogelasinospora grovesii TaxID=303347 RepID=A0AAN6NGF9_9PEZI|nr:glycoprotease family-domain-containing protein [Diplogelasinospora grovesii]